MSLTCRFPYTIAISGVGVKVGVFVGVNVGVFDGVGVNVDVGVGEGVNEAVGSGVELGLAVWVAAELTAISACEVPANSSSLGPQAARKIATKKNSKTVNDFLAMTFLLIHENGKALPGNVCVTRSIG
jgi:hypothetical protein